MKQPEKTIKFTIVEPERWDVRMHKLEMDGKIIFSQIAPEPEDAVFGRDLFTGQEAIELIKLGMKLQEDGYAIDVVEQTVDKW